MAKVFFCILFLTTLVFVLSFPYEGDKFDEDAVADEGRVKRQISRSKGSAKRPPPAAPVAKRKQSAQLPVCFATDMKILEKCCKTQMGPIFSQEEMNAVSLTKKNGTYKFIVEPMIQKWSKNGKIDYSAESIEKWMYPTAASSTGDINYDNLKTFISSRVNPTWKESSKILVDNCKKLDGYMKTDKISHQKMAAVSLKPVATIQCVFRKSINICGSDGRDETQASMDKCATGNRTMELCDPKGGVVVLPALAENATPFISEY